MRRSLRNENPRSSHERGFALALGDSGTPWGGVGGVENQVAAASEWCVLRRFTPFQSGTPHQEAQVRKSLRNKASEPTFRPSLAALVCAVAGCCFLAFRRHCFSALLQLGNKARRRGTTSGPLSPPSLSPHSQQRSLSHRNLSSLRLDQTTNYTLFSHSSINPRHLHS